MAYAELNLKQRQFVDAYIGRANFNATQAALLAGYSERSARSIGHENLKKPEIAEAIEERMGSFASSANEIIMRLTITSRNPASAYLRRVVPPEREAPEPTSEEELIRRAERKEIQQAVAAENGEDAEPERFNGCLPGEWFYDIEAMLEDGYGWLIVGIERDKFGGQVVKFRDSEHAEDVLARYRGLTATRPEGEPEDVGAAAAAFMQRVATVAAAAAAGSLSGGADGPGQGGTAPDVDLVGAG